MELPVGVAAVIGFAHVWKFEGHCEDMHVYTSNSSVYGYFPDYEIYFLSLQRLQFSRRERVLKRSL